MNTNDTIKYNLDRIDNLLQPRERMILNGAITLSDQELLTVLLGSGIKGHPVHKIAEKILKLLDKLNQEVVLQDLLNIVGLGNAKALTILAALELGRRIFIPRRWKIQSPQNILPLLAHYSDREQEHFIVCTLNGAHEIISNKVVSVGLLNRTLVHPREVFRVALMDHAASIILAHNHPSGNVTPSKDDVFVTKKLVAAGKIFDIAVLDHIIFCNDNHFSFHRDGLI